MDATVERVLFVHTYPVDSTISTGGTLATLVDAGVPVTVLTCTRGEDEAAERELRNALELLGVSDHRFLGDRDARWRGEFRRYRSSGAESGVEPVSDALLAAEFGEVAADIAAVIDAVHPTVVVGPDDRSPHHERRTVGEAARRAADVLGVAYYAIEHSASSPAATVRIDVQPVFDRKTAALAAQPSSLTVDAGTVRRREGKRRPIGRVEAYRRVRHGQERAPGFAEQTLSGKIIGAVIALLLGVFVGGVATVSHQTVVTLGEVAVPIGVIVSTAMVAGLLAGLRIVFGTRILAGVAALGVLGIAALMATEGAGGSVLVADNTLGWTWVFAPVLVAALVLGWPDVRRGSAVRMEKPRSEREPTQ